MNPPSALLIGTGEYTTGYVHGQAADSDKKCGVVGLVFFDLRSRGKVGSRIGIVGTSGRKFPGIRKHLQENIGDVYCNLTTECETFPEDAVERDTNAYLKALDAFAPGDAATIFTPDDTHYDIAMACIERGVHVILTKPPVKTLQEHRALVHAAEKQNVLVMIEVHKRYDPVYNDARNRIRDLGDFNYFNAYMSQPKHQLETFKSWAGKSSDISYYLNSHHIDFHNWCMEGIAVPERVTAFASSGVAKTVIAVDAEDTICLLVEWRSIQSGNKGVASYTASWAASKADVHSQQRFFYLGAKGEITVDQAHRGYTVAEDGEGFKNVNPLYMRYTPDEDGNYVGQQTYGYQSFEVFIDAVQQIRLGKRSASYFNSRYPTAFSTLNMTAILEAGRKSLDNGSIPITIRFDEHDTPIGYAMNGKIIEG